jgi:hypothetical protein
MRRLLLFISLIFVLQSSAWAWEPTESDIEEAFLVWSKSGTEFSGRPYMEAEEILYADSPASAKIISRFIHSKQGFVKYKLFQLCYYMGSSAIRPAFRPMANLNEKKLGSVYLCLGRARDHVSVGRISKGLGHKKWGVRSSAAISMGYIGWPQTVGYKLAENLSNDSSPIARKSAAYALGTGHDTDQIPVLFKALKDSYYGVRFNAMSALSKYGDDSARLMTKNYDDSSDTVKFGILYSTGMMKGQHGLPLLNRVVRNKSESDLLRGLALKGLKDRNQDFPETVIEDIKSQPFIIGIMSK